MSEDLGKSLQTYKLQLQQVEAALTNEPDNSELQTLKKDLQEVIDLTTNLLKQQSKDSADVLNKLGFNWKVGDSCLAIWSEDGQYYPAEITQLKDDGECTVSFSDFDANAEVTSISSLKQVHSAGTSKQTGLKGDDKQKKKFTTLEQRELKKKKTQKKLQKQKELESQREDEKNKWQQFSAKATKKKGVLKKSIFATPDSASGRVGVGTCNIGGKPMTEFHGADKWRRAHSN